MTERVSGEFHKYEKNPNYWNPELPYLDGLILNNARWGPPTGAQFLAGQCDVCFGLDPEATRRGRDDPEKTVLSIAGTSPQQIVFNTQRAPMNDARVRRAVHIVTDYGAMRKATSAVRDFGPAGFLLPGDQYNADYWAKAKDQPGWRKTTADDIAQAKKLLADAGYADGIKDPIVFLGRDSAKGRIVTATTAGLLKQVLGIESETFLNNSTIHYEIIAQQEYDIADTGAAQPLPVVHLYMGDLLSTDRSRNWHAYSNPALDKLVADMDVTSDPVKYGQQVQQIIDIMDQDVPFLIYGHASDRIGWTNIVKGNPLDQVNTTDDGGRTRMDTIWLDQ
jgi:ABC-type transport system substrate-binding protein